MQYKRPESVLVVLYTEALEILLLQRCDVPTFWQSVTGSLRMQEVPWEAALREVAEETGVHATAQQLRDCHHQNRFLIQPPWRVRYAPDVTHNVEHVFTLRLPTAQSIQLNPLEHRVYCWLPYASALERVTAYTNRDAIRQYVGNDESFIT